MRPWITFFAYTTAMVLPISDVHADNQLQSALDQVKDELQADVQCSPANGHVPEAERSIRFLKERICSTFHRLPCKALPTKVMKVLVMESSKKTNFFPNKQEIPSDSALDKLSMGRPWITTSTVAFV